MTVNFKTGIFGAIVAFDWNVLRRQNSLTVVREIFYPSFPSWSFYPTQTFKDTFVALLASPSNLDSWLERIHNIKERAQVFKFIFYRITLIGTFRMHVFMHGRWFRWKFTCKLFYMLVWPHLHHFLYLREYSHVFGLLVLVDEDFILSQLFFIVEMNFTKWSQKHTYEHTHARQMSIWFWNISHIHSAIPLVLLHRTIYWESSTNYHLGDIIHVQYSSFNNKKKCPQRTVQFKLFWTSSKSSKMILCLWHFFSLLFL